MGCNLRVQSGRENRCPLHPHTILTNSFSSSSSQSQFLLLTTREIWCLYWSPASSSFPNPMAFSQASVQFSCRSVTSDSFATSWIAARQASLSITNSWSLLKLMSFESVMPSNHLILCCPLLLPPSASGSFPMSQFFTSGGQSTGVSVSASILLMNIQGWSSLGLTSWIFLYSKGLSRVFSKTTVQKHQFFGAQLSL